VEANFYVVCDKPLVRQMRKMVRSKVIGTVRKMIVGYTRVGGQPLWKIPATNRPHGAWTPATAVWPPPAQAARWTMSPHFAVPARRLKRG